MDEQLNTDKGQALGAQDSGGFPLDGDLTLGSLFSGSGSFELAGLLAGVKPVWLSEVEPFPLRVTEKRLPGVKHYGDVSKLSGAELPPVDIITFGFPCTDISIAGKREGLHAARSGLFFQAIRIIKEMREETNGEYPKYAIAENVKALFSSNKGGDFREVLTELCRIRDADVDVPMPEKGKWPNAGLVVGDDYSIAWRLFNTAGWGLPQRRERIYLVADFADERAGEVLFKPEGLSWHTPEGFRKGEESAACFGEGSAETGRFVLNDQGGSVMSVSEDVTGTLRAQEHGHQPIVVGPKAFGICSKTSRGMLGDNPDVGFYEAETSRCLDQGSGSPTRNQGGMVVVEGNGSRPSHKGDGYKESETMYTLNTTEQHAVAYHSSKASFFTHFNDGESAEALVATDYKDPPVICNEPEYIVRRLTPTECLRLQGLPDWWCDGIADPEPSEEEVDKWMDIFEDYRQAVTHAKTPKTRAQVIKWLKDPYSYSAVYKMAGNGVSIPIPYFILCSIAEANKLPEEPKQSCETYPLE